VLPPPGAARGARCRRRRGERDPSATSRASSSCARQPIPASRPASRSARRRSCGVSSPARSSARKAV
jgi:hypothetical protein